MTKRDKGRKKVVIDINEALDGYHRTKLDMEKLIKENEEEGVDYSEEYMEELGYDIEFNHEVVRLISSFNRANQRLKLTNNSIGKSLLTVAEHNKTLAKTINSLVTTTKLQADAIDELRDDIKELKNKEK